MSIRTERIAKTLQTEISDIVANEIRDEDIKFVTITHLKLATDLSYAKIYFTTLLDDKREKVLKDINKAKGFIKSELCKRKLKIRKIPELEFVYDESIEYGFRIENIIKNIKK
jgi:ribosome-binding factor A